VPIHGERWELRSVIVDPSVRGQGVGQRLVGHLLNRRSIAGKEICCVTRHPRFFLRFGFEALGTPWETGRASCRSRKRIAMHRSVPRRLP
jgi:predicted N-acetyltransferase YhbS